MSRGVNADAEEQLQLVADGDEVLAELLRHGGRLLRHHGLLVDAHDQG